MFCSRVRARSCKKVYKFALNTIYLRFKAFCVASRGGAEKKNTKKYAKILVYQKNVVILHRGFVRALGACSLKFNEGAAMKL